jgi:hypothetical protein
MNTSHTTLKFLFGEWCHVLHHWNHFLEHEGGQAVTVMLYPYTHMPETCFMSRVQNIPGH